MDEPLDRRRFGDPYLRSKSAIGGTRHKLREASCRVGDIFCASARMCLSWRRVAGDRQKVNREPITGPKSGNERPPNASIKDTHPRPYWPLIIDGVGASFPSTMAAILAIPTHDPGRKCPLWRFSGGRTHTDNVAAFCPMIAGSGFLCLNGCQNPQNCTRILQKQGMNKKRTYSELP